MNLLERDEFIKASPAIQIQGNLTFSQWEAWNLLLANAYDELPNKEFHRISIVKLAPGLSFYNKHQDYLKRTLKTLLEHRVEWSILGKDKNQIWGVGSLLASAEIENGICTYSFAPHLRYKLYNPRIYTKLNLRLQDRLASRYALMLWELCFDYFDTKRDEGETPLIPLEKFKALMGISPDTYPIFKHLNHRVIKPAIKEINALRNFSVEMEQKRERHKVAFLKFRILRLKQVGHMAPELLYPEVEDLPAILVQAGVVRREAVKIANQEWDAVDAAVVIEDYRDFATYVEEKIAVAQEATPGGNIGGFIVEAIRENYQDPVAQARFEERKERERQAMGNSLESEFSEKRSALLRQAIRTNPGLLEIAAERIEFRFVRQRLASYNSLHEAYRDGGLVTAEINAILAEEFCQDLIAPVKAAYEEERDRILA